MSTTLIITLFIVWSISALFIGMITWNMITKDDSIIAMITLLILASLGSVFCAILHVNLSTTISGIDLANAQEVCKDFGGIETVDRLQCKCKNGLTFDARGIKLPPEQP